MRVLVCGGRDYEDRAKVFKTLDDLHRDTKIKCVIVGGAPGADRLGYEWAQKYRIPIRVFPADWNGHGKAAGPIRNQEMLDQGKPDLVVAFPGGRGTNNMTVLAKAADVSIMDVT